MPLQDEALAVRAAAGDSAAFAELYDRYERRAYNLCYRITGTADDAADATQETFLKVLERLPKLKDRELNFGAYVMTAARNASYDVIERRKRSAPTGEIPESAVPLGAGEDHELPERVALRDAHQEQIRLANESLPARQREVLALRELGELSYGEVAQIMGMNENSVAQLISRARINLRDGLRQTALGSVASASPQCDRAMPLLAMHQDGLLEDPWLVEHLMECGACRVRLEAMEEAGVAYRQWLLLVPALWLREDTAKAAERVNGGEGRRLRMPAAGAAATLVLVLALLTAEGAQSPAHDRALEAEPAVHVTAKPKPVKHGAKKTRTHVKEDKQPRKIEAAAPKPEQSVPVESEPAITASVVAAPEPVAPNARPRREPVKTAATPDPPPPATPEPVDVVTTTTTPVPPTSTPDGTTSTPTPNPCTSAAGCPPPGPPQATCRTCGLAAPPPPPPRQLRLVDPSSVNRTP